MLAHLKTFVLSISGAEKPGASEAKKAWCRDRLVLNSTGVFKSGAEAGKALCRRATLVESNPSKAGAGAAAGALPAADGCVAGPASSSCHNWTFLRCAFLNVSSNVALPVRVCKKTFLFWYVLRL